MTDSDLRSLFLFALGKRRLGAQISVASLAIGLLAYFLLVPYGISTTMEINDAQTSQLQAFTNNFFSLSKTQSGGRKAQTPSQSAMDYLDRQDTYSAFVKFLVRESQAAKSDPDLHAGAAELEGKLGAKLSDPSLSSRQSAGILRRLLRLRPASATELTITATAGSRPLAYFLSAAYSRFAMEALRQHEEKEMEQIRSAIEKQRDLFKEQFAAKNKELIAFQSRPENVLSLASGANVGNYISELLVRKNEVELKIAENERAIQYLGGERAAELASARKLGARSQAQQLVEENLLLRKQVIALSGSIRRFTGSTNGAAEAMRMHEELKKTSDREFKNFQEANDLLSKLAVYAISIAGKFELVHAPEPEDVRKASSLYLMLALSFFLGQAAFSAAVYFSWTSAARKSGRQAETAPPAARARESLASASAIKIVQDAVGRGVFQEVSSGGREKGVSHNGH